MKILRSQLKNIFIISMLLATLNVTAQTEQQELVFLNWDQYVDPEVIRDFEVQFNAKVKQIYFDSDEIRTELLLTTGGKGYDVAVVVDADIAAYVKRGWLTPIDEQAIPNLQHIDLKWLKALDEDKGYAVPYLWGTLGILYRKDLIQEEITHWKQLYQPKKAWKGKIVMINNSKELIGLALKSLGYSANSSNREELAAVKKLLLAQKPYVNAYEYPDWSENSKLMTGEIWMAMIYNGDALALKDQHPEIAFTVPAEGSLLWCDYLTILANSQKKKLAMDFINFLTEPQNAARLAKTLHFATPNIPAKKLLSAEHLNNPFIYPALAVLSHSEMFTQQKPRIRKKWNAIYFQLVE